MTSSTERNRRRQQRKAIEKKKAVIIAAEGQARHDIPKWRRWNNADKKRTRDILIKQRREKKKSGGVNS